MKCRDRVVWTERADERLRRHLWAKEVTQRNSLVRVFFFWYVSLWYGRGFCGGLSGMLRCVGLSSLLVAWLLFLCTTRRHERPWNYWFFVLVLFHTICRLAVPFIKNQRTCFKGDVYLYTGISLAHLWFVLVGVILLFLSLVAWCIDHHLIIGIKISMWKLGLGSEWFWCLRSSSTSVPGEMLCSYRPNVLFSCRRCSTSYRGQVDAWGRPHGEGSWADEFFCGDCFRENGLRESCWADSSRERQGRMRHSIGCLWIASGPSVLRHFGRTRESRGSSDAWNPQNFLATAAHGPGWPC